MCGRKRSKQAGDAAVVVDVDVFGGRDFRQAGHREHVARERDEKARPGGHGHAAHGHGEARGRAEQCRVVRQARLRLGDAHRQAAEAERLQLADLSARGGQDLRARAAVDPAHDSRDLFLDRCVELVGKAEAVLRFAQAHDLARERLAAAAAGGAGGIEPMSAVNGNNELRELFMAERKEIERILAELSAEAAGHREQIKLDYDVLLQLECIYARARLSFAMRAICPEVRTAGQLHLLRARHPLITGKTVVPISVRLGSDFDTLIITGPNTGGKTVTLKTIGLLTLMAECGLHIPADDGSAINVYEQVFADIGDEQSIEQSLSTFSSHTKNIVEILKVCDKDSLVLFDELCAGTDPAEGAALAISIIEFCRKCGAGVAATTHYAELKLYAMRTSGVMNASCEFNVETLQPTYRLLIGVPGKSNAFAISKRLGIDEAILEQARSLVSQNDVNFEDVLTQLDQQRQEMEKAKEEAERLRRETEKQKEKSDEYYAQIKQEKEKAAQQARKEAQYIIDDARRAADAVYEELKQLRKQAKNGAFVPGSNEKQAQLRRNLNEAESRMQPQHEEKQRPEPTRAIRIGDTV